MTAEIGRVLGGRYRLVAPIGMGASAQVYLADDVKLRRRVALKMLHDALAGDAEFLRRFRAEARAAAALSHPNVMAVYDWGDGEVAFIVTEYLPGGSLRGLLDASPPLTPAQALGVGLEAARALDYAHRRGFVHRDIKPANLLFGEEQRLRIADFGLARALAEAAWTEPQGAVLGTARYASPEQAKGETLSGKADVYALALVLVEAVTGEVPFVADTTLGTLMARVDKPLVVPDSLGPLQSILVRAGHPDPEQRIDARTLASGLLRAAKELSRPAPLPLAGALAAGSALLPDPDPTVHAEVPGDHEAAAPTDLTSDDLEIEPPHWVNQATAPADPADAALLGAVGLAGVAEASSHGDAPPVDLDDDRSAADAGTDDVQQDDVEGAVGEGRDAPPDAGEVRSAEAAPVTWADSPPEVPDGPDTVVAPEHDVVVPPPVPQFAPAGPVDGDAEDDGRADDDGHADEPRRRRKWPWVALVLLLVLGAGGGAAAIVAGREEPDPVPVRTILLPLPKLVGLSETQARAVISASGWTPEVAYDRKDLTLKDRVIASTTLPGTRLEAGATVAITVSEGQELRTVPTDLVGASKADAVAAIEAAKLKAGVSEEVFDEEAESGVVVALAEGTPEQLETGGTVDLVLSKGPAPRTVPSGLRGSTLDEAQAALEAVQLGVAEVESFSDDVAAGTVISVSPGEGTSQPRGTVITLEVSKGPELVAVPGVGGADDLAEAIQILEGQGFVAGEVSGSATGRPTGTSPAAGTMVAPGSTIDIVMG